MRGLGAVWVADASRSKEDMCKHAAVCRDAENHAEVLRARRERHCCLNQDAVNQVEVSRSDEGLHG
jgi:hypothetical protein